VIVPARRPQIGRARRRVEHHQDVHGATSRW
jgi:hypothetical protein